MAGYSLYLPQDWSFISVMQAVVEAGLRGADWPEEVEGTYLRMDVPHIVPHLLSWLEQQKPGTVKPQNVWVDCLQGLGFFLPFLVIFRQTNTITTNNNSNAFWLMLSWVHAGQVLTCPGRLKNIIRPFACFTAPDCVITSWCKCMAHVASPACLPSACLLYLTVCT